MKKLKLVLMALPITLLLMSSCKKEGCTDPDSKTYNADAKKDDGSCQYEGNSVLWYNETTSNYLQDDGAITLTYYVDGVVVGSSATSVYWTGSPDCGQNGSITITKDLGDVKSKSYTYSVIDQTGYEYWAGSLNFMANTCEATELIW